MINFSEARSFPENPFIIPIPEGKRGIYAMYHNSLLSLGKDLPTNPDYTKNVAYVGSSSNLKNRIRDHIIRRNSSVVTGVSATVLNPDKVSHICWWCPEEALSDKDHLEAAELVAFEVLNPSLRSRGSDTARAQSILGDAAFQETMENLFRSEPCGLYYPMTFDNLVYWTREFERRDPNPNHG